MRHLVFLLLLASVPAPAATPTPEMPPQFINIPAVEENAWLTMECTRGKTKDEVSCVFSQVRIEQKTESKAMEEAEKFRAEFLKHSAATRRELAKMCADWKPTLQKSAEAPSNEPFGRDAARIELMALMAAPCACEDDECRIAAFSKLIATQERICRIRTSSFSTTLRRISKNKWVNTPVPAGLCNAVTAIVVERKDTSSWTFTQTRITVDKDTELCSGMAANINRPYVFSSDAPSSTKMDCRFVTTSILGWD
ncbi:hypothetical protein NVS55_27890 [Myxococcus stipitatus]|uniref:hypothetical protein n=1 Tax=Myxococcus stipitatus TaxID=83455 RepID=UPI0031454778